MDTTNIGVYDEMVSGKNSLRPHWREIMALVWSMPPDVMRDRQVRAESHFAATEQYLHQANDAPTRRAIDLLPLILPEDEWRLMAEGLAQRARLLNLILVDIYGPQMLVREKLLPPCLVFNNPGFLRPLRFVPGAGGAPPLHFYAADLVRQPDGRWRLLADRTQAPAGLGYALRNRSVAARSFPEAYRSASLHSLQPAVDLWRNSLQEIGSALDENPCIVLLTPGPHNAAYGEHVLLAHELEITLVQGSDLTVREGMVYLKTLNGLSRIHVIYRRVDGDYCDPLELRPNSALGVAGLTAAARAGNVVILNLPGSAMVESPAFAPFLPAIARRLLSEELVLPAVTTWWCGQKQALAAVLTAPDEYVLRPAFTNDAAATDLSTLSTEAKAQILDRLRAAPADYVAIERIQHSRLPAFGANGLEPRPVVLRASAVYSRDAWMPMPGGVAHIADDGDQPQTLRRSGIVKDVWVLKGEPGAERERTEGLVETRKLHHAADVVGGRIADDLFWFGRYIERVDAGLRQLRAVVTRLIRGMPGPRENAELELLASTLGRGGWITESQARAPVGGTMFAAGIMIAAGPNGELAHYQTLLRQLGVATRNRLSQDMWRVVDAVGRPLRSTHRPEGDFDLLLGNIDATVGHVAAFHGLVAENLTRGMGWRFLEIGRRIERGILTCSIVDELLTARPARIELGVRLILELCDSLISHRNRFPTDPYTLPAVDIVLSDTSNPRALIFQLKVLSAELAGLIGHDSRAPERQLIERLIGDLDSGVVPFAGTTADDDRLNSLASGARKCRSDLAQLSDMLSRSYFAHSKTAQTVMLGLNAGGAERVAS